MSPLPNNITNNNVNSNEGKLEELFFRDYKEALIRQAKQKAEKKFKEEINKQKDIIKKLTGDNQEINDAMKQAQNYVDNDNFDAARTEVNYALSLQTKDINKVSDNYVKMILQYADNYIYKINIDISNAIHDPNVSFDVFFQNENYIQAFEFIENKLAPNMFTKDIRQIQIDYLFNYTNDPALFIKGSNDKLDEDEIKYIRLTYEFAKEHFGNDDPNTLKSINNLADLRKAQNNYNEAESLYKQAVNGRKKILGHNHDDTLESMSDLANLYRWWDKKYGADLDNSFNMGYNVVYEV